MRSSPRAQLAPTNNPLFRGRVGPWGRCSDATETNMLQGMPWGAICVQSSDDSRNSAIRTAYRISLRSSSLREPRYPLLGVLFWLLFLCFLCFFLRKKVRNCCNQQLEIRRGWCVKIYICVLANKLTQHSKYIKVFGKHFHVFTWCLI